MDGSESDFARAGDDDVDGLGGDFNYTYDGGDVDDGAAPNYTYDGGDVDDGAAPGGAGNGESNMSEMGVGASDEGVVTPGVYFLFSYLTATEEGDDVTCSLLLLDSIDGVFNTVGSKEGLFDQ